MADDTPKPAEPRELKTINLDRQLCQVRFSPDGHFLVGGGYDASIRRLDFSGDEPRELEPIRGHHGWVWRVAIAPAGDVLFAADSWGGLAAWPFRDEQPQAKWSIDDAHDGWIRGLDLTADGSHVVTAGRDTVVRLWTASGERVREFRGHEQEVYAVAVHPDGKSIVSADLMGTVRHWNAETGECVRTLEVPEMHYAARDQDVAGLHHLLFHDGGRTLICAGAQPTGNGNVQGKPTLRFHDWETLKLSKSLVQDDAGQGFVYDLDWRPEGFFAAVTSGLPGKGQVLFWRPEDEKPFFATTKYTNTHSLAWHPDGKRFVVVSTNRNSQGNGAVKDKDGKYLGNFSPLHVLAMPDA